MEFFLKKIIFFNLMKTHTDGLETLFTYVFCVDLPFVVRRGHDVGAEHHVAQPAEVVSIRCQGPLPTQGRCLSSPRLNNPGHDVSTSNTSSPELPQPLSWSFRPSWPAGTRGLSERVFYPGGGRGGRLGQQRPPVDNASPLQAKERTHLIMGKSLGFKEEHGFTHVAVVIRQEVLQELCITLHSC